MESRKGNGRNDKRKFKNQIFSFRMIMQKFRMTMRNGLKDGIMLHAKK